MKPTLRSRITELNRDEITRRRVLATAAGASAVGIGATAIATDTARANVTFGELSIPDATHGGDDPEPTPVLDVVAAIEYDVPEIDELTIDLLVGSDSDDRQVLDSESMSTGVTSTDTTRDLSAPITDADAFEPEMFAPDAEEMITVPISVALRLTITAGGETVAEAFVEDTAAIQVTNTAVKLLAQIGGTGEITFE